MLILSINEICLVQSINSLDDYIECHREIIRNQIVRIKNMWCITNASNKTLLLGENYAFCKIMRCTNDDTRKHRLNIKNIYIYINRFKRYSMD